MAPICTIRPSMSACEKRSIVRSPSKRKIVMPGSAMSLPVAGAAQAWALAGFNVGVEFGQLAVVAVVAVQLALARRHNGARAERLVYAASLCVVAAGGWWFVERTFLAGGV